MKLNQNLLMFLIQVMIRQFLQKKDLSGVDKSLLGATKAVGLIRRLVNNITLISIMGTPWDLIMITLMERSPEPGGESSLMAEWICECNR